MAGNTVVLADQDEIYCAGLASILARTGRYQVLASAHDGASLLQTIRALRPQMVIMDQGFASTCLSELHSSVPETRIVILSPEARPARAATPAVGVLSRSQDPKSMIAALDSLAVGGPMSDIHDGRQRPLRDRFPIPGPQNIDKLSPRERQVLEFVAAGYTSREIAEALGITQRTVEVHRHHMLKKLDLRGVADLVKFAIRAGLTDI